MRAFVLLLVFTLLLVACRGPARPTETAVGEPTAVATDTAPQEEGNTAPACCCSDSIPAPALAIEGIGFAATPYIVHTHQFVRNIETWYGQMPMRWAPLAGMLTQAFLDASLYSEEERTELPATVTTNISHPRPHELATQHVWIYLRFPSMVRGKLGVGYEKTVELAELVLYGREPGWLVMLYLRVGQDTWLEFQTTVTYEQIKDYVDEAAQTGDAHSPSKHARTGIIQTGC